MPQQSPRHQPGQGYQRAIGQQIQQVCRQDQRDTGGMQRYLRTPVRQSLAAQPDQRQRHQTEFGDIAKPAIDAQGDDPLAIGNGQDPPGHRIQDQVAPIAAPAEPRAFGGMVQQLFLVADPVGQRFRPRRADAFGIGQNGVQRHQMRAAQQRIDHHDQRQQQGQQHLRAARREQQHRQQRQSIDDGPETFARQQQKRHVTHRQQPIGPARRRPLAQQQHRCHQAHQREKRDPQPVLQEHHRPEPPRPDGLQEIMLEKPVYPHVHLRRKLRLDQHRHRIGKTGGHQRHAQRPHRPGISQIAARKEKRQDADQLVGHGGDGIVDPHALYIAVENLDRIAVGQHRRKGRQHEQHHQPPPHKALRHQADPVPQHEHRQRQCRKVRDRGLVEIRHHRQIVNRQRRQDQIARKDGPDQRPRRIQPQVQDIGHDRPDRDHEIGKDVGRNHGRQGFRGLGLPQGCSTPRGTRVTQFCQYHPRNRMLRDCGNRNLGFGHAPC